MLEKNIETAKTNFLSKKKNFYKPNKKANSFASKQSFPSVVFQKNISKVYTTGTFVQQFTSLLLVSLFSLKLH